MANITQEKREKLLNFLEELKKQHSDDDSLRRISEIATALNEKKYGLVWEKHTEEVDEMLEHNIPVFKEVEERKIVANKDEGYNFLLEGDNLHSLKLLEKTHKGKIDVIYIDPPYNTGNKDFIYNDKYVDKTDGYSHSKWLSFMSERLEIARELLSDEGVIFISIDDNEQAQLKLLCDEVFGENNFESFIWKKKGGASNTEKIIGCLTEYIHCYFKNKKSGIFNYRDIERIYKYKDEISEYNLEGIEKTNSGIYERKTMIFDILNPNTNTIFKPGKNKRWTIGQEKVNKYISENKLYFDEEKMKVYRIKRPYDYEESKNVYYNLLLDLGSLSSAKDEINNIIGEREIFSTPKPVVLINHILKISSKKNSTILDFFAGSGTTGHAVAKLNAEDGGNRKYILCTNNENNICEEVTYQRLKNIQEELPHNLKYFKTDFISKYESEEDEETISEKMLEHVKELIELEYHVEMDHSKYILLDDEDVIEEVVERIEEDGKLFITEWVFLGREHKRKLEEKNVEVINIPEYYYRDELQELGEI